MTDDMRQQPKNLGMTEAEVLDAYHAKATVRYWPVIGQPGRPHVGRVHGISVVEHALDELGFGLRIEGKAGWVLPSHCEVVGDAILADAGGDTDDGTGAGR